MKTILFYLPVMFFGGFVYGQNATIQQQSTSSHTEVEKCRQHLLYEKLKIDDPARFATIDRSSTIPHQDKYTPIVGDKATGLVYTIPVVFHILHNGGTENISDAQVQDALAILNRDYRRLNADANAVATPFIGMPTDVEVEFVLAKVAPNGACFNGITRTQNALTNNGDDGQAQVNAIIAGNNVYQGVWGHSKYLNIYVAKDIGGAAGYTYLPNGSATANATNMYYNGIFILDDYCGSIGTGDIATSRALTHEVGHWLNLPHVWGDGNSPGDAANCNDDDGVQDTPNCKGVTSCTLNSNGCNSDDAYWGTAMIDNVENYMDYSYCSKMFTQGQVTKMRAALVSNVGGRSNIWTTANLQAVGVLPGSSLCSINFSANQTNVCAGTTITYTPNQTSGIATYAWTFPGGTPATSSAVSPTVTYSTVGIQNATLVVTSSVNGNSFTMAKTSYINVNDVTMVSAPIVEGFTAAGTPTGWAIYNPNGSATTWVRSTAAGAAPTTGNSFMMNNFNFYDHTNDELQVAKFSTASMSAATLTFDVAYAPRNAIYFDGLDVLVSTDCGATFTTVYSKSGTVLATRTATTSSFTPTAAQWRNETIDLTPFVGQGSVLISFKNIGGRGNRLFIDNVNISGIAATPTAGFTPSSATPCISQSVTFTDASTAATSWSWNFGAGATPATATGAGPHSVTYSSIGSKTVTLTINGGDVETQTITVGNPPATPTISAGGLTTFCAGGNVVLTSSAGSGNVWSNGLTTPSITVINGNTYTVTVGAAGCSATSAGIAVVVNPTPTVTFASVPTMCDYDSPVTLTQGTPAGGTYSGPGVTGNQFNPTTAGVGTKTLTYSYTDGNGCSNSQTRNVVVSACAGLDEKDGNSLVVFPNPSTGIFKIKSEGYMINSITVFNQVGQIVMDLNDYQFNQDVDLSNYSSGVYTLKINHENGVENVRVMLRNN